MKAHGPLLHFYAGKPEVLLSAPQDLAIRRVLTPSSYSLMCTGVNIRLIAQDFLSRDSGKENLSTTGALQN